VVSQSHRRIGLPDRRMRRVVSSVPDPRCTAPWVRALHAEVPLRNDQRVRVSWSSSSAGAVAHLSTPGRWWQKIGTGFTIKHLSCSG